MKYGFDIGKLAHVELNEATTLYRLKMLGWQLKARVRGNLLYTKSFGRYTVSVEIKRKNGKLFLKNLHAIIREKEYQIPKKIKNKVINELKLLLVSAISFYIRQELRRFIRRLKQRKKRKNFIFI